MTDKLKKARNITDLFTWFSMYFSFVAFVLCFADNKNSQYILALAMLIPFTGTILLSIKTGNLAIYTAYHLILIIFIWIIQYFSSAPGIVNAGILTAAIIIQMIVFLSKRLHSKNHQRFLSISPVLAVLFFILWIFADGMEISSLTKILPIAACLYMLCSVLGIYLTNMINYIESNREMANIPAYALIRSGNGQMAIFMVLAFAAILLFTNAGLDRLLSQLKNLLLSGIRFIFSFAPNNTETIDSVTAETAETFTETPSFVQESESSPVMMAVSDFLMTIIQIVLIIGAAAVIIYGIYQLWLHFNGFSFKRKSAKEAPDELNDVIEKIQSPLRRRSRIWSMGSGLPENKIRRIYYKKIQSKYKKQPVKRSLTPQELTDSIKPSDKQIASEFTEIYEQVRYSRDPRQVDPGAYKNLAKKL